MIFTCKNFKWNKNFTPENRGVGGGSGNPLSFPTLSLSADGVPLYIS